MNIQSQVLPTQISHIKQGQVTHTVYALIKDARFTEVIKLLESQISSYPKSRPLLSILAYSYYQIQDYTSATEYYLTLTKNFPDINEYQLYYAQSLYKSGQHVEAQKACFKVDSFDYSDKIVKLQAAIKFELGDLDGCGTLIDQSDQKDPEVIVDQACLLYKHEKYAEACVKYNEAYKITGFHPETCYYIALCNYQMKKYVPALKFIADIIEKGVKEHPELCVGMASQGLDIKSVGNSQTLHETFLIEAFNLKAAIEFTLKNYDGAREALADMPPRLEQELDHVTLHNSALMNMDQDPTTGFEKLNFLLSQTPCPPQYEYYELCADLLAENQQLVKKTFSNYLQEYLEATALLSQTAPDEAYKKFEDLSVRHINQLRRTTTSIQEARSNHNEDAVKIHLEEYDQAVESYIPILMAQAKIYWDKENYEMVEKIFRKSVEFCNEVDVWKLNVAHVLFMQESKYKEAISFYEPIILQVTAIVLANLCVSYIMTSQNEEAEELMRQIEKEEERTGFDDPNHRTYHLCIVNLVIGTLYCSKGNYEFGISRIIKSLEPFNKKLGTDTWFYAKRCFVSLYETLAKQMILLKDSIFEEILVFFDQCEAHGRDILVVADPIGMESVDLSKNSVAYEARLLKSLFLQLYK